MLNFEKMNQTFNLRMGKVFTVNGDDGASAYEIAVENGFQGTEEEWLQSLHGKDGQPGRDGVDGAPGADGKSAYQYAVDGGYGGSEAEFAEKLAQEIPEAYELPTASETVKGGVKVGKGLLMDGEALGVELEAEYELIETITVKSENAIFRDAEPDGTPYNFKAVYVDVLAVTASKEIPGVITFNGSPAGYFASFYHTSPSAGQRTRMIGEVRNGILRCYSVTARDNGATGNEGSRYTGSINENVKNIRKIRITMINGDTQIPEGAVITIKGVRA